MPYAELPTGAHLHYEDLGSGPPVILLHGLFGTARSHFPALIDWLRADYRVIGPSLRGYGKSTPKPRSFPLDFYRRDAEDILALIAQLDLPTAHLMGYSDGGEVALMAASMQPERFRSVVTWAASGYFSPAMRPGILRMYPVNWFSEADRSLHGLDDPQPVILQWIRTMKMLVDLGGDVSLSQEEKITCPVLMLLGDQDALNPVEGAQVMVARLPEGHLEILRCGHAVHNEQWVMFQRIVGDFLHEQSIV